jgi:Mg2+ and Co2+ transporter CorA
MVERFTQGKLIWINLKNPTTDEVTKAMNELSIPPVLMTDLTTVVPKNTATRNDGTIKITLDFPTIKHVGRDRHLA